MTRAPDDLLAAFAGRFTFAADLGGGEGTTLRVVEAGQPGCERVLKVLPPGVTPQEASLLRSLRHPAIPSVLEVGRLPDGRAYVLREHRAGTTLRSLPTAVPELRRSVQELLEVLAYVHLRAVLHLDLKPANLVRDEHGRLHLLDFGLGARRGEASRGGTPFYAAPELLLGLVPDHRADLFSLGAMVAAALLPSGKVPFAHFVARFPAEDFATALGTPLTALPAPFDQFVARCVARRPAERFQDAQEALEFLTRSSGRPSPALLLPDPVVVFGPELAALPAHGSVEVSGSDAAARRNLALHLLAARAGARELRETAAAVTVVADAPTITLALPALTATRLEPHLAAACGLRGAAATTAADWLLARGGTTLERVHDLLLDEVRAGAVVPAGSRWSWPAAQSGRLPALVTTAPAATAATPAAIHAAAARGQRELALQLWRHAVGTAGHDDRPLREALVDGLLAAGEPAQALPFCADLPLQRAQALLDLGDTAAAGACLTDAPAATSPLARTVRGQYLLATGDRNAALQLLHRADATLAERLLVATALEQGGDDARSDALLAELLPQLPAAERPFLRAIAVTELGHNARRRGDLDTAAARFGDAAALLFGIGQARHAAKAQQNLGVIAKDRGDHAAAVEHFREARSLFQHAGDAAGVATIEANLGIAALAKGDAAAARQWLATAVPALQQQGNLAAARLALVMAARAAAELGDRPAALAALAELGQPDTDRLRAECALVHSRLAAADAAATTTAAHAPPTAIMSEPSGPSRELFRTFLAVNRQLAQEHDLDKALRHLLDAAVTLTGGRHGFLLVQREGGMQREFQSGDPGPAGQAFSRSLAHRAIDLQRTLTGADGLADRDLQDMPSIRNLQIRSAICAPFRSAGGVAGAVYVEHPGRAGAFVEADKQALEVLADQAAIAVDRMLREAATADELQASRRELAVVRRNRQRDSTPLLGECPAMRDLKAQIVRLAPLALPVLVLGETGTGKELVARALHDQGPRGRGPFVAENCSALSPELMERELFGHVQGAFTGADRDRPGLLELANGGTLFLDEVGDMPPALQTKLLRALQERVIRRVGGEHTIPLDLRLVAATHKDLRAMVQRGEFREDLFFRLAAIELRVPPLRERGDDRLLLAEHFLRRHATQHGRQLTLGATAKAVIAAYGWPGNVRELDHVLGRAALLGDRDEVNDLGLPVPAAEAPTPAAGASPHGEVITLKEAERRALLAALQAFDGDKTKAARALEVSRTALYEKLKRHGIG